MTLISHFNASAGKLGDAIHCLMVNYLPPVAKEEKKLKGTFLRKRV
jgi:hypothetical protein